MNRRFRLTRSTDFKRVRRVGKSYAHPLVVLLIMPNESGEVHIGISASRSSGKSVQRNRAKRLLREAIRPLLPQIHPGWSLILLSRSATPKASLQEIQGAITILLKRAEILKVTDGN